MAVQNKNAYMFDVIASSFFQKRSCRLPGIGNLEMVTTPAEYDFANRLINAPRQTILFVSASSSSSSFNEFSAISQLMKDELDRNGSVEITGLGSFTKDSNGNIHFTAYPVNEDFMQPVVAEKVIHKDAEHTILVGDREKTNVEMNEFYNEDIGSSKDRWWIWALVMGVAATAAVVIYISMHGFNDLSSLSSF